MPAAPAPVLTRDATVFASVASPVGDLTLLGVERADGVALAGCLFDGEDVLTASPHLRPDADALAPVAAQLREYFAGQRKEFDLELEPVGTPFQHEVWARLRTIPYGETRTYGQLAAELGSPNASRAVGLANGRNPIAIIVPCHRVIGADGTLTGYAGGMDRKRLLLDLEAGVAPLL